MTHQRQLIREAVKVMVLNQGPWLERVYTNRNRALSARPNPRSERSQLPALVIYTRNEKATIFNAAPREYKCEVEVVIEIVADATDDVDDLLDTMAATVERIIGRDDTLAETADDCEYVGTDMTIIESGVERSIGAVALSFQAVYYRMAPDGDLGTDGEPAPDGGYNATLPDLVDIHVDYSLDNEQEDPRDRAQTHIEGLDQ
jgi:hypothetical protein